MFGIKEKHSGFASNGNGAANGQDVAGAVTTVIAKGTNIEGKFFCSENVRLDGEIQGEVRVEKRLVMGETAVVYGNIYSKEATIKGKVKGDLFVNDLLVLMATASIEGNIAAKSMNLEEGAKYNGNCKIGVENAAGAPKKVKD